MDLELETWIDEKLETWVDERMDKQQYRNTYQSKHKKNYGLMFVYPII